MIPMNPSAAAVLIMLGALAFIGVAKGLQWLIESGKVGRFIARALVALGHDYSTGAQSRNPIKVINGGPGGHETPYMARVIWTPNTRWGQGYFHCFLRHDIDRDPHDHPFAFTTIPLNRSYVEEVFDKDTHCFRYVHVRRWRKHYRPSEHCHRVVGCVYGDDPRNFSESAFPLFTIVWRGASKRTWGFWTYRDNPLARGWVKWTEYVVGKGGDNLAGPADHMCPGGTSVAEKL